jgi:galactose mutarotase-like enzyme
MITFLRNGFLEVSVGSRGAELQSLRRTDGPERLWQGDPGFWRRRAPVLFPIVGKLRDDQYVVGGRSYALPQHGFARDRTFGLVSADKAAAEFALYSDEETLAAYPFEFELRVRYELEGESLQVRYDVSNAGAGPMWFSIGGHPGFACPFRTGDRFEDFELTFEREETADSLLLEGGLVAGRAGRLLDGSRTLPLAGDLFAGGALILEGLRSSWVALQRRGGGSALTVRFDGWPRLGLWTKPGAPFLCVEPWHGIADRVDAPGRLEEKEGILRVEKGGRFSCAFEIGVEEG